MLSARTLPLSSTTDKVRKYFCHFSAFPSVYCAIILLQGCNSSFCICLSSSIATRYSFILIFKNFWKRFEICKELNFQIQIVWFLLMIYFFCKQVCRETLGNGDRTCPLRTQAGQNAFKKLFFKLPCLKRLTSVSWLQDHLSK